jgi:hypothetical protein
VIFQRPAGPDDVGRAVSALGLGGPRPVLTVVGGAGGLGEQMHARLTRVFGEVIAPAVARHGAVAVDGGTDSGVMRLLGRARADLPDFPLIGVAAVGTVDFPGNAAQIDNSEQLDANHTHFVVVPGGEWGTESPYLPLVAEAVAAGAPRVTVLVNGGDIALADSLLAIECGIPLLVLSGTGRLADTIAAAVATPAADGDERIARLARSKLVRVVSVDNHRELAGQLDHHLTVAAPCHR